MSKETLKANLREIPDFPIPGILFYDVTTLFKNPECLQEILDTRDVQGQRHHQSSRY